MEAIYNVISQNPETAVDVLSWACFGSGILIGFFLGFISIGLLMVFDIWLDWLRDRKAKKSGKLTTEQRFELLEDKIDSLADIVISTSPEVK